MLFKHLKVEDPVFVSLPLKRNQKEFPRSSLPDSIRSTINAGQQRSASPSLSERCSFPRLFSPMPPCAELILKHITGLLLWRRRRRYCSAEGRCDGRTSGNEEKGVGGGGYERNNERFITGRKSRRCFISLLSAESPPLRRTTSLLRSALSALLFHFLFRSMVTLAGITTGSLFIYLPLCPLLYSHFCHSLQPVLCRSLLYCSYCPPTPIPACHCISACSL